MVDILLPQSIAERFEAQIERSAPGKVRLIVYPASGGDAASGLEYQNVEIAISGQLYGTYPFKALTAKLPKFQWVHSTGAGMDQFITPDLERRGVVITNSSGVYAPGMVEYILSMLVYTTRDFAQWRQCQREHRWGFVSSPTEESDLNGKRIGVIGYGGIGRRLAAACDALGMEVWACGTRQPESAALQPLERFLLLPDLPIFLNACDFVVIACPLNSQTRGMIGAEQLAQMKAGAVLVNVARGPIVDSRALIEALRLGKLRYAILDVTDPEPLPPGDPLWDAPNVIITPHISGDSPEGWQRCIDIFCHNLLLYLEGRLEEMKNLVDYRNHL